MRKRKIAEIVVGTIALDEVESYGYIRLLPQYHTLGPATGLDVADAFVGLDLALRAIYCAAVRGEQTVFDKVLAVSARPNWKPLERRFLEAIAGVETQEH